MTNIFGDRLSGPRTPVWRNFGHVVKEGMTASEAIVSAGLDYRVIKQPHEVWYDGILVNTTFDLIRVPNDNNPDPAHYGTVGDGYQPVDNMDLGFAMDPLSKIWPVDTVGALSDGRHIFMTFRSGKYEIAGDEMDGFLLFMDGKDGKMGATLHQTDVRLFCGNTLRFAAKTAQMSVPIAHNIGAKDAMDFWSRTLPRLQAQQSQTRELLRELAHVRSTRPQVASIMASAYPKPPRRGKVLLHGTPEFLALPDADQVTIERAAASVGYYEQRQEGFKEAAMERYDVYNQQHPQSARTLWAAVQAVVETEDYRRGPGEERQSALFGDRANAKKRAFARAFDIAGIKV